MSIEDRGPGGHRVAAPRGGSGIGRRTWLAMGGGGAAAATALPLLTLSALATPPALAQSAPTPATPAAAPWPERPVRIIVPVAPGGPMDLIARGLAERLFEAWRQPVVVENRPGAGTAIGTEYVARAAPDGYTLLLAAVAHVMNPPLLPRMPYDPVRDFTPILQVATQPMVLAVHPSVPAPSLAEFVALAKARDTAGEPVTIGSAGVGTSSHLAAALFGMTAGFRITHVPYSGSAPLQTALLSGQLQASFLNSTVATQQVRAGRVRGLAATGRARWRELPEVPTIAESGWPEYEASAWYGFLGPAGLPAPVIERVRRDMLTALHQPDLRARLMAAGLDLLEVGPQEFGRVIETELAKWTRVVRESGLRTE